jgi:hypothetical protein
MALENLNNRYSNVVEAHGTPSNNALVKNITNFIKESDDLLISVSTSAKGKLIEKFKSAEIAKPQPATDEEINTRANTYMHFYNQMQNHYRQNPAFFKDFVDQAINEALEPSTGEAGSILNADKLLRVFTNIINVLDEIFGDALVGSPKANFTPLLEIYNKIRQEQSKKFYQINE